MIERRLCRWGAAWATATMSCALWAADFPPESLRRVVAYDGPPRERQEVALLFSMDGRPDYESATICEVDGVSMERDGVCASVVHVLPGPHRLKLRYRSNQQFGTGHVRLDADPNQLYQINFSSLRIDYAAKVSVIPLPQGAKLTWRHLAPGLAKGSPRLDEAVPYAPNSERGMPVQRPPVSESDQQIVDQLLACAGKFAVDIELRKNSHQAYESRFATVGAFIQAAAAYVGEDDAISGMQRAQRRGMRAFAAALSPSAAGTEASREARAQLAADLEACNGVYTSLRPGARP